MIWTRLIFAVVLAVAIGIAADRSLRAHESQEASNRKAAPAETATPLLKTLLYGVEGKEVNIIHIDVPPGFVTPKHYHPGQLFIYVLEGAVTIEMDGKPSVKLGPGDVFEEPQNQPMVGKNPSSTHGAKLVVFQIGDKGKPLTVDVR